MIKYNIVGCCYDKMVVNVAVCVVCVCVFVCVCLCVCVCVCVEARSCSKFRSGKAIRIILFVLSVYL
jgi:hypothetical protein